jgi:hypothetical protein
MIEEALMTREDFETLSQLALIDVLDALGRFKLSDKNRSIYAVALAIVGTRYVPTLCINAEGDAPPVEPAERLDVYQDKYNALCFAHLDENVFSADALRLIAKFRKALDDLAVFQDSDAAASLEAKKFVGSEWNRLYDGYESAMFSVLNGLNSAIAELDTAPHCVAFFHVHDNDEKSRLQHLRATISPADFDFLFPVYRQRETPQSRGEA